MHQRYDLFLQFLPQAALFLLIFFCTRNDLDAEKPGELGYGFPRSDRQHEFGRPAVRQDIKAAKPADHVVNKGGLVTT